MTTSYPTISLAPVSLFRRGTLEFGPKVLFRKDDEFLDSFFTELFRTYRQLLKHCDTISLCCWLGDGTDILQYDGALEKPIAWARWQGFAHPYGDPPRQPVLYTDHPVELTYGDLKRVIAAARRAASEVLGKPLSFILPFDPGSEFTEAPFRYERHPEILLRNAAGSAIRCIDAISRFHADSARYAGYPEGIPEGTPFGEFLGRQARFYFADIGADGLWFSNSFGFGRSPYASGGTGQFFDGEAFHPDGNRAVRDEIIAFWEVFRRECPDLPVLCRGTDFPVGMNLANHASAYRALYENNRFNIVPPPNTPWPALNRNEGLALAGTLTQNAPFPDERMVLRFYVTDQWFCNNPWFDRWDRAPYDLYLNASLCKFSPEGKVCAFSDFHFMGVDGSWGETPSEVADEVIPHFKRAAAFRPDAAPPLIWVYPFEEYDALTFGDKPQPDIPFGGDLSILGALNHAFPLSGAITTSFLSSAIAEDKEEGRGNREEGRETRHSSLVTRHSSLREAVLVTPAPLPGSETERLLLAHLADRGRILCYGTLRYASPTWLAAFGLAADAEPLEGEFDVVGDTAGAPTSRLLHDAVIGQGGLCETTLGPRSGHLSGEAALSHEVALNGEDNGPAVVLAEAVAPDGQRRVLAAVKGLAAWTRGGTGAARERLRQRNVASRDEAKWFAPERLYNVALGALGWFVRQETGLAPEAVQFLVSRNRGGFVFTGHSFDDDAALRVRAPWGAPIPLARRIRLIDGASRIPVRTWFHDEVRVFVRQREGVVGCRSQPVIAKDLHRRWLVDGLENADVRFYVQPGHDTIYYRTASTEYGDSREPIRPELVTDGTGTFFELSGYTGELSVGWN
jgi:hypothetical protein